MVDRSEVEARLATALETLLDSDQPLLEMDVAERAIAGRLGIYLHGVFPSHAVDIEYNRMGAEIKRLVLPAACRNKVDKNGGSLVYPDIVVHQRGHNRDNLLAIEIKKSANKDGQECDRLRAIAYKDQLGYQHAAVILFDTRPHTSQATPEVWWA